VPWERESLADSAGGMRGAHAGRARGICVRSMRFEDESPFKGGIIVTAAKVYQLVVLYNA
jgi:hypothetical protein